MLVTNIDDKFHLYHALLFTVFYFKIVIPRCTILIAKVLDT